jgi:ABC-type oligopeptide transport system substrate-binding subunit
VVDELPEDVELLDLGCHRLKDMHRPEWIHQLLIEGLPGEFPPVKSLEMLPPAISLDFGEIKLPAFLEEQEVEVPLPVFVGREREMTRLGGYLDRAQAGKGGVVFITGGPGRGKTALMQAFARHSMETYPDLLVASGKCNAYTGVGDPYLPFREVLDDLTGDVEAKWAAGAISSDHAKRLWEVMPYTAQALVDHGPDLVEVFVAGKGLVSRASRAVPEQRRLLQSLRSLTERERTTPGELEQKALFEQYLDVLCDLSSNYLLLILLDDLQWSDGASLNLLFHLGRELSGGRTLLLGAYRPEEVALGRGGERHPLEEILAEFKRLYGDVWIDLSVDSPDEGRTFVTEFLNSEPNRFSNNFREALFTHTEGHPLFTIELLREMQARGDLVCDEAGRWVEGSNLDWDVLPARVEGVIEARIGHLEDELRDILTIASVEGEDFTAQVVARVKEASERGLVRRLSGELDKVHRLVGERGILQIANQQLYLYRFRHSLFQQHIYNGLGEIERKLLHREVGEVLEILYGDQSEEVAGQLAWHFSEAGEVDKAIYYDLMAGDRARRYYAYQEAIEFYQRAIGYLKDQRDYDLAARTLMKLGLTYHTIFDYQRSRRVYDEAFAMRKRERTIPPASLEPAPHPYKICFVEPTTLDPSQEIDDISINYIKNLFSGLVELGRDLEILPDGACSWEISEDGCRYLFHLRDDAFWSDGEPVTAGDYEYSWKRTLTSATKATTIANLLYDIQGVQDYHKEENGDPGQVGVKALDDLTLEVVLERPASYFLHLLTRFYPVPRHVVEVHGEAWTKPDHLVSNGSFLLDSYLPGEGIMLVRNPSYHGRFPGNLQVVEVKFVLTAPVALERYESNGADIVVLYYETYSARKRHLEEYVSEPEPCTYYVTFDASRPPFDDLRVRCAFIMAVDRNRLAGEILAGHLDPATGGFLPPSIPGHSPGIALPYDPDQARQLLAQAGYPDGQGLSNLEIGVWPSHHVIDVEFLIAQWSHNLNVEVAIDIIEWKEYLEKEHSTHLIYRGWAADCPDPDNFLRVGLRRLNFPQWRNETYERLLEDARRTLSQGDRIPLYQAADKILIEEAVIMPLLYRRVHWLVKPWVKIPGGWDGKSWKDVIIEPH